MTKPQKTGSGGAPSPKPNPNKLDITIGADDDFGKIHAHNLLDPALRHASLAGTFAQQVFGKEPLSSINDNLGAMREKLEKAADGDLRFVSRILTAQAVSLDTLFTELVRRAGLNMGQYPEASERYMRMAFKAQSGSRSTLEALTRLHQPREQTVKHVHVNQGGQAIVADQFHQQGGGSENDNSDKQSHATGQSGERAALSRSDTQWIGMSVASGEGQAAMQDARRD